MSKSPNTRTALPEEGTGKHRQEDYRAPSPIQEQLHLIDPQDTLDKVSETYEVMRKAVGLIDGGRKTLALEMGEAIDYEAHIANGLNRRCDRHAFVDWLVPLLKHPEAGALLIGWFCVLSGHEQPKRRPIASAEERLDAVLRVIRESGVMGDDVLKRAAVVLGVDVGSFRR